MVEPVNDNRRKPIPIPAGGFQTNEEEADWLARTLTMRFEECIENTLGVKANAKFPRLYDLLLLSLNSATRRGKRMRRELPDA